MDNRHLKTLEFNKIVDMLSQKAQTSMGEKKCLAIRPIMEKGDLLEQINYTYEGVIAFNYGSPPISELIDISSAISRADKGGILSGVELYAILRTLQVAKSLKVYFNKIKDLTPCIVELYKQMDDCLDLKEQLLISVTDNGYILDTASSELKSIRKQIFKSEADLREKLDSFVRSPQKVKHLQEGIITQRNGRYVVPVRSDAKGQVPGIVHDYSSTGSTIFIEPTFAVEIANRVQELRLKESQEIERILYSLTNEVTIYKEELLYINNLVGETDFILAKAKLARQLRATQPRINDDGIIIIKEGRHPLIPYEEVVPMSLELGKDFRTLVITGPNTGGKTVTLKTVGLLSLMAQSGLFVPANEGCSFPILEGVYADIGDEQSIEQSLSTFSSHMTNIVNIITKAQSKSLVLFDELGAGTDPIEGSALATSIMDLFKERGVLTIATTHYSQLKSYAYENQWVENASVEFDHQTLRPTYKLLVGIPGKSNAFEISKRLGLNEEIIHRAKSLISKDTIRVDEMIKDLEEKRMLYESKIKELEANERELKGLNQKFEQKQQQFVDKKEEMLQKAREEASKIIRLAKREGESLIKEIKQIQIEASNSNVDRELQRARERIKSTQGVQTKEQPKGTLRVQDIKEGIEVKLIDINQTGTVLTLPDEDKQVLCQVGIMKVKTKIENLQIIKGVPKVSYNKGGFRTVTSKSENTSTSLDLRGQNVEEAILNIDKFLDNSFISGFKEVAIVHGKGTGALRNGVRDYLKRHPQVKNTRLGGYSEGGDGASIVTLK